MNKQTVEIKLKNTRAENIITAISLACDIAGLDFDYEIGYACEHQVRRINVWIEHDMRSNTCGMNSRYNYFHSNKKLLDSIIKLFNKKYNIGLRFV